MNIINGFCQPIRGAATTDEPVNGGIEFNATTLIEDNYPPYASYLFYDNGPERCETYGRVSVVLGCVYIFLFALITVEYTFARFPGKIKNKVWGYNELIA